MELIIIIAIIVILFLIFKNKKNKDKKSNFNKPVSNSLEKKISNDTGSDFEELYEEYDSNLRRKFKYIKVKRRFPRNTFIEGDFTSKYRGELFNKNDDKKEYKIELYQVNIQLTHSNRCRCIQGEKSVCNGIHQNIEQNFTTDKSKRFNIDQIQLPKHYFLRDTDGDEYKVNLEDPKIFNFESLRQFHQSEEDEVFGVINGKINGHILDYTYQDEWVRSYEPLKDENTNYYTNYSGGSVLTIKKNVIIDETSLIPIQSYFSEDKRNTLIKEKPSTNKTSEVQTRPNLNKFLPSTDGCLSTIFGVIFLLILALFIGVIFPNMWFIILFFAVIFLLYLLPAKFGDWILSALGILYFLFIIAIIILPFWNKEISINLDWLRFPKYTIENQVVKENPKPKIEPILENNKIKDSIIVNYKTWQDYNGNSYEGTYRVNISDFRQSRDFKHKLHQNQTSNTTYNKIIHLLKENDQPRLNGVYVMFDSIKHQKNLDEIEFANMIIGFIQDFNYHLILPQTCDPSIYNDRFIKKYLNNNEGPCYPNQPFGINSPIEFMANSIADCDTRTLTIYTILSHYNYDVVVLSSDYYGHSLLGVNLPYNGRYKYIYQNKQYTIFETTVAKSLPGAISNEIANLNHWKISLMSK